jgi:hypothetical protein
VSWAGRAGAVGTVALVCLALYGCTPQPRPEPLTPAQIDAFERELDDAMWLATGLEDSLRPSGGRADYVSLNKFDQAMPACMADATSDPRYEALRYYLCQRRYPLSPSAQGFFSSAELEAIYDYYQDSLVPCLEIRGVHISSAPSRWDTGGEPGYVPWNPYWTLRQDGIEFSHVEDDCPALPGWAVASN